MCRNGDFELPKRKGKGMGSQFRVLVYHERELLCSYEGAPPDEGESLWITSARGSGSGVEERRFEVTRRMWRVGVHSNGTSYAWCEVMVKE